MGSNCSSVLAPCHDTDGSHFAVLPRCGTCDTPINASDKVVALVGDRTVPTYFRQTDEFPFPNLHWDDFIVASRLFCRNFERCGWLGLAVPVHADCLNLLRHNCPLAVEDALRRVWTIRAWSLPLFDAAPLDVEHPFVMSRHALDRVSAAAGLPQLPQLPAELLEMTRVKDPHSWFWRAVATLTLAADLPNMSDARTQGTLSLEQIAFWDRDTGLTLISPGEDSECGPLVRIAFDAHGIKKLERLHGFGPSPKGPAREDAAYVVAPLSAIRELPLSHQNGRLRIQALSRDPSSPLRWHLQMWNTPSPPLSNTPHVALVKDDREVPVITRAFELRAITGITRLYRRKAIVAVHVHDAKHPTALAAYRRLFARHRFARHRKPTWTYLPVNQATDPILAMGFREAPSTNANITTTTTTRAPGHRRTQLLVRQQLSGDTHMGDSRLPNPTTVLNPPRTLDTLQAHPTTFASNPSRTSPPAATPPTPGDDEPYHYPPNNVPCNPPFAPSAQPLKPDRALLAPAHRHGVFSTAPLSGVERVDLYRAGGDEEIALAGYGFEGAVFYYANGARRAVGHVRVGVDEARRVVGPVGVVVRKATVLRRPVVSVEFLVEGVVGDGDAGAGAVTVTGASTVARASASQRSKRTYPMTGDFRCWCDWPHVAVEIAREGEEEDDDGEVDSDVEELEGPDEEHPDEEEE
ncbi:uncharacterized protein B0H64DRAFT_455360 [Chaetomium fimeti]|uniref:Uncharacterized protein n=1 Tax=Chaetomium fimeti TaxID=1854472 RepID=A0AAE0HPH2_9PEZI|nr:hypothetical protein B0H64DRAFT_455360 [Chaetomium fimeti]